jgi:hypothetical protein
MSQWRREWDSFRGKNYLFASAGLRAIRPLEPGV